MIKTIIGVLLLLVPFLLVIKFKNKKLGFFYILSFLIGFHFAVALITQLFGIFNYWVVIGINILVAVSVLIKTDYGMLKRDAKKIKINWFLILILLILFFQFYSIHYNYIGEITSINQGYTEVSNLKYPYPYFSDEWSAIAFIKYSLRTGKLPLANSLWYDTAFPNLELPFHSFVSEMILLLGLNPLTQYTILTIFTSLIICLLVYFILRFNNIDKFSSGFAALLIPYIINGANLPGLWTLVPLTLGLISMLLGFLFMSVGKTKIVLFLSFFVLIFYPPLFVLFSVALIFYFISLDIPRKEKIKLIKWFFIIAVCVTIILFLFIYYVAGSFLESLRYVASKIFYETFTRGAIPSFTIWKIIPLLALLFFIIGLKDYKRKSWLVAPIIVGLLYWWVYSFILWRFIIEFERVVITTSILIVLLSGFGFNWFINTANKFDFIRKYKIIQIMKVVIILLFLISSFSYTQRDNWKDLKLYFVESQSVYPPASPANTYLHESDLKVFEGITNKNFLASPWKGLVIGVATDNYPMHSKPSTITNEILSYGYFISKTCEEKKIIAAEKKLDYVYAKEFNCAGFKLVGKGEEGFYLYETV